MLSQLSATQIHPTDVRLKWNESAFVLRVLDGSFDWGTLNLDTDTNDPMLTDSHELTCFSLSFSLSVWSMLHCRLRLRLRRNTKERSMC